jgi:hypothetical protein
LFPVSAGFLLALMFDPENGGNMFLRNVDLFPNYTVLQSRGPLLFIVTAVETSDQKEGIVIVPSYVPHIY